MPADIVISIDGNLGFSESEKLVGRIRAAMRNTDSDVVLQFSDDARLSSAEFLAFLSTAKKYMSENDRKISVRGASGSVQALLVIAGIADMVCE